MTILETIIIISLIALAILFIPSHPKEIYNKNSNFTLEYREVASEPMGAKPQDYVSPSLLARTLGYRPVSRSPIVEPVIVEEVVKAPQNITGLSYLGFVTTADGTKRYMFKNNYQNMVERIVPGEAIAGFTLVEVTVDGFFFKKDNQQFILNANR